MEVEIRRSKYVWGYDTLEFVGDRLDGVVYTRQGPVTAYSRIGWARLRVTIDGRECWARVSVSGPLSADRLRRLAGRFARTVATLAAGRPEGKGPFTVTLAR